MTPQKIRTVIVDDDDGILTYIRKRLGNHPRIELVGTGNNGRDAVHMANRLRPDVMVLDFHMPGFDGLEAAARIIGLFPRISILVMSGDTDPAVVKEALRVGARDFLEKPGDMSGIGSAIERAFDRATLPTVERKLASVWAFHSPKGFGGATTLAVNTALDLAMLGHRVLLVDLDVAHGDCSFHLDLPPAAGQKSLFRRIRETKQLSTEIVTAAIHTYAFPADLSLNIDILTSPEEFVGLGDEIAEKMQALIDFLTTRYDCVIADIPSGRMLDDHCVPFIDAAEILHFTMNSDLLSLKNTVVALKSLLSLEVPAERFLLLLSRIAPQPDIEPRDWIVKNLAGTMLQKQSILDVPTTNRDCGEALTRGLPLIFHQPTSPLTAFVQKLSGRLKAPAERPATRTRFWDRVWSLVRR